MDLSVRGLAARQLADYRARTPGTSFAEEDQSRLSLDGAYAVQGEVASLRAAEGDIVRVTAERLGSVEATVGS